MLGQCYSLLMASCSSDNTVGCRYRLGSSGTAKALTLFREGWSALPIFAPIDRAAVMIVGASMIPYNPPKRQHVRPLRSQNPPFIELSRPVSQAGLRQEPAVASAEKMLIAYMHGDLAGDTP